MVRYDVWDCELKRTISRLFLLDQVQNQISEFLNDWERIEEQQGNGIAPCIFKRTSIIMNSFYFGSSIFVLSFSAVDKIPSKIVLGIRLITKRFDFLHLSWNWNKFSFFWIEIQDFLHDFLQLFSFPWWTSSQH